MVQSYKTRFEKWRVFVIYLRNKTFMNYGTNNGWLQYDYCLLRDMIMMSDEEDQEAEIKRDSS